MERNPEHIPMFGIFSVSKNLFDTLADYQESSEYE